MGVRALFGAALATAALFTLVACSHVCESRHLHGAPGSPPCSSSCRLPVMFRSLQPEQPMSYACTVSTDAGQVIGYQYNDGTATCTVVDGEQVRASEEYTCLCQEPSQTQGLDTPGSSGTCADSCLTGIDGEVGAPVAATASYACLASSEIGVTNRFGSQTSDSACHYGSDGTAQSSTAFSCVCLFSPQGSTGLLPSRPLLPQVEAATAG